MYSSGSLLSPDPQEKTFRLLVHALLSQASEGGGSTFILGAGCSLTSSEKDISTVGIVRSVVEEIEGTPVAESRSEADVYRDFVNYWSRFGEQQTTNLISRRLAGLEPSVGYRALRALADERYLRFIITTNFDLLIDEVMNGLSYRIIYGNGEEDRVGDSESAFTLVKVHGDIKRGGLRFSPRQVLDIPQAMIDCVKEASSLPTVVLGYKGQDLGLMRALDRNPSFNAFWVNPELPNQADSYTYYLALEWLRARHSEANCLFGSHFGRFDEVVHRLVHELGVSRAFKPKHPTHSQVPKPWATGIIGNALGSSKYLSSIFFDILVAISDAAKDYPWTPQPPHFSTNYERHLEALLYPLDSELLPDSLLTLLENEFDALVVAVSLALRARVAGVAESFETLLWRTKRLYSEKMPRSRPDEAFWAFIEALADEGRDSAESTPEIRLILNSRDRLRLAVAPAPPDQLRALLGLLDTLVLLSPTASPSDSPTTAERLRILLQEKVDRVEKNEGRIHIFTRELSRSDFLGISDGLFGHLPDLYVSPEGSLRSRWINFSVSSIAKATVDSPKGTIGLDLFETLTKTSAASLQRFHSLTSAFDIISDKTARLRTEESVRAFLSSKSVGLFIIGPSGCGKTTAIRCLFPTHLEDLYMPVIVNQVSRGIQAAGLNRFLPSLAEGDTRADIVRQIKLASAALESRSRILVLVLDGLNESITSVEELKSNYADLLDLADCLAEHGEGRIRLLVTCRDVTFLNLLQAYGSPNPMVFHWEENTRGQAQPYHSVPELDNDEQSALIDIYFDSSVCKPFKDLLAANSPLSRDFGRPYMLAVAGATLRTVDELDGLRSVNQVFSRFAEQMLSRLGDEAVLATARGLIKGFFKMYLASDYGPLPVERIRLLSSIPINERSIASDVLRSMEDVNILQFGRFAKAGYVDFSHDRIAEYFLGWFLYDQLEDMELFRRVVQWSEFQPICGGGIRELFSRSWSLANSQDSYINVAWGIILNNIYGAFLNAADSLSKILVRSLISCRDVRDVTRRLFQLTVHRSPKKDESRTRLLMHCLLKGAEDLARGEAPTEILTFADLLEEIWKTSRLESKLGAQVFLIQSIAAARAGDLDRGLRTIRLALRKTKRGEDAALRDKIAAQKAVLIRDSGNKRKAQRLLTGIYQNQVTLGAWEEAAKTALDLGMALRDDTKYAAALSLYEESLQFQDRLPSPIKARLNLQSGIIYKNLAQRELKKQNQQDRYEIDGNLALDPNHLLEKALALNDDALNWAELNNSLALLMEALTERSECLLILARSNPAFLLQANLFLDRLEALLRYFPSIIRLVDFQRLKAVASALQGEFSSALEYLNRGRELATSHLLFFKACDCDYQIGLQVLLSLSFYPDAAYCRTGLAALNRALDFYQKNVSSHNEYLQNVIEWRSRLEALGKDLGFKDICAQ